MSRVSKAPEIRRQEMIETAYGLFRENGYDRTTVHDIVERLGVAQGLFYYYFKSKEEILFAALEQMSEELLHSIAGIIATEDMPPVTRIREAFLVIGDFLVHGYDALCLPAISAKLHAFFERQTRKQLLPYLTQLLTDGKSSGDFDIAYPEHTARFILAGFIGLCLEDAAAPTGKEISILVPNFVERILSLPEGALISAQEGS